MNNQCSPWFNPTRTVTNAKKVLHRKGELPYPQHGGCVQNVGHYVHVLKQSRETMKQLSNSTLAIIIIFAGVLGQIAFNYLRDDQPFNLKVSVYDKQTSTLICRDGNLFIRFDGSEEQHVTDELEKQLVCIP